MSTNGFDDLVRKYVGQIDDLHERLESLRGSYMADCKAIREDIAEIYELAKDNGIATKPLKAEMRARALDRKAAAVREALDDEHAETREHIALALGGFADSPLGEAAVKRGRPSRAKPSKANADTLDELADENDDPRPRFLKEAEAAE